MFFSFIMPSLYEVNKYFNSDISSDISLPISVSFTNFLSLFLTTSLIVSISCPDSIASCVDVNGP